MKNVNRAVSILTIISFSKECVKEAEMLRWTGKGDNIHSSTLSLSPREGKCPFRVLHKMIKIPIIFQKTLNLIPFKKSVDSVTLEI